MMRADSLFNGKLSSTLVGSRLELNYHKDQHELRSFYFHSCLAPDGIIGYKCCIPSGREVEIFPSTCIEVSFTNQLLNQSIAQ